MNVRDDVECTFYIERLVVNLLRFSVRLVYSKETTSQLIQLLSLLLHLSPSTFHRLGQRIIAGVSLFIQTHGESIGRTEEWVCVLKILEQFKHHTTAAHAAFQTFTYVVENHCTKETFVPLLNALTAYSQIATSSPTVNGSTIAVGVNVPSTSSSPSSDVWLPVAPEAVLALLLRLHSKLCTMTPPDPVALPTSQQEMVTLTPEQARYLNPHVAAKRQLEFDRQRTDLWLASVQNFCNLVKNDERSSVRKAALEALNK